MRLEPLLAPSPLRTVQGVALHLHEAISFWGGVSAADGRLTDPRSAAFGRSVSDRILFIRELRGSSSASSILLELIYRRLAPSAIVLVRTDAILALGAIVAAQMHWPTPGIFRADATLQDRIAEGVELAIASDGELTLLGTRAAGPELSS